MEIEFLKRIIKAASKISEQKYKVRQKDNNESRVPRHFRKGNIVSCFVIY